MRISDFWIRTKLNSLVPGPYPSKKFRQNPFTTFSVIRPNNQYILPKQTRLPCCKCKLPLPETFSAYFCYLQIPYLSHLPANSFTCKFQRATFTAKFHYLQFNYLQIHTTLNSLLFTFVILNVYMPNFMTVKFVLFEKAQRFYRTNQPANSRDHNTSCQRKQ